MKNKLALGIVALIVIVGILLFTSSNRSTEPEENMELETSQDTNSNLVKQEAMFEVTSSDVTYFDDVTGYYSEPAEEGEFPGVVMIHEWWGLNENIKDMADELAGQGYRVLAVDLFGTVATTPDEARAQTQALDTEIALQNMTAAKEYLNNQGSTKVASLGWCFGGGQSLQMSLNNEVDATVIYYGSLVTDPAELIKLNSPVLGIFGSEDTSIPVETVNEFEETLNELEYQNDINIYEGVGHAFANPSGANYAPEETMDAWAKTLSFLETNLK